MKRAMLGSSFDFGIILVAVLKGGGIAWAQVPPTVPMLVISSQAVTAAGMSPAGAVVWMEMARKSVQYEAVYVRRHGIVQADALGKAQLPVAEAVPLPSIWIAVDLKTGGYATASPAGFLPQLFALAPGALNVRGAGLADQLVDAADYAEVLLVRPGKGAWGKTIGRGGADDESSPSEPAYKLALDRFAPVSAADGPPPAKLLTQDLLFVFHPQAMEMAVATFGGKP